MNSGKLKDLNPTAYFSRAHRINNSGLITGAFQKTSSDANVLFYYTDATGMVELKTAITNLPAGASLASSATPNDSNQIVTSVTLADGRVRPALLNPVPQ